MMKECRSYWHNRALGVDSEIERIDAMEEGLGPRSADFSKIRELISN